MRLRRRRTSRQEPFYYFYVSDIMLCNLGIANARWDEEQFHTSYDLNDDGTGAIFWEKYYFSINYYC